MRWEGTHDESRDLLAFSQTFLFEGKFQIILEMFLLLLLDHRGLPLVLNL